MLEMLLEAMEEQERKDFSHLDRLYDRFLKAEEAGCYSKAKELYDEIKFLETEMGLRGTGS